MTINLSANSPRVSYTVNAGATTSTFAVSFEFFAAADLNVYVDGALKVLGSGSGQYAVSGGGGSTGAVALSVTGASGNSTVVITRDIDLERTTDFPSSGSFQIATLNTELDRFVAIAADLKDSSDRSLQLTDFDAAVSLVLPDVATRKGKVLAFNASTGAVEAGPSTSDVQTVSANAASVALLGTSAAVADLAILATDAVVADMAILATSAIVADMAILGTDAIVADMAILATDAIVADLAILATDAIVADMAILATSDIVTDMNLLATAAVVEDMGLLATSAVIEDMGLLATSAVIEDMGLLAVSAIITDMSILGTADVVADMNTLATSDIVADMNLLATSAVIEDMGLLATSAVIEDMGLLATSAVIEDMGLLATSAVIEDMGLLATSAVIEDMGLLATSAVISDMSTLAGSGANPNITSVTASGVVAAGSLVVDEMTLNADTLTATDTFTIDAAGDITLDADGADIRLSDAGTQFGKFTNSSSDFVISSSVNDKDIIFRGADGGNNITALTLDMENAGTAIFNHDIKLSDDGRIVFGAGADLAIYSDGTNGRIEAPNGDLVIDLAGDIILDVDGGDVIIKDGGTEIAHLSNSNSDFKIESKVSNKSMLFRGNDGGSGITALTLDMEFAGAATFNSDVILGNAKAILFGDGSARIIGDGSAETLKFFTSGAEKARFDASGNLLVGKTSANNTDVGTSIYSTLGFSSTRSGGVVGILNRKTNDGDILTFRQDDATIGSIGVSGTELFIGSLSGSDGFLGFGSNIVKPVANDGSARDNVIDLGNANARFDDIHATNGTIQTSDRNEKQDIASLTSAEMLVAKRISALFKTFRWKDKVAAKGDKARTHSGIIAQDVQAAFTAESLDAGDYSLFIFSTWWEHDVDVAAVEAADAADAVYREVTDSDGIVTNELVTAAKEAVESKDAYTRTDNYDTEDAAPSGSTSRTRLGIRYPELLSFLAAYNEQRFASIETRLTALEL